MRIQQAPNMENSYYVPEERDLGKAFLFKINDFHILDGDVLHITSIDTGETILALVVINDKKDWGWVIESDYVFQCVSKSDEAAVVDVGQIALFSSSIYTLIETKDEG